MALKARIRWGLTATPIHNGIQDYYCLLHFLNLSQWQIAKVFQSHPALKKYLSREAKEMAKGRVIDLSSRETRVSKSNSTLTHGEITLRRTKSEVFSQKREREGDDEEKECAPKKQKRDAPVLLNLIVDILPVDFATVEEETLYRQLERSARLGKPKFISLLCRGKFRRLSVNPTVP